MPQRFVRCCWGLLAIVVLALAGNYTFAQTVTASVRGIVTDPSGAVIPDAIVTATNVATGVMTATKTDSAGAYNIQTLPIGSYMVSGTKIGFNRFTAGPLSLEIDQIAKIDIKLSVGSVAANVEVSAEATALLQTENASLGTTITGNTLESLPLSGENFLSAALFVPGAVNPTYDLMGGSSGTERDTNWGTQPSINGNRQEANNYILDGADINEPINDLVGYNPAPESLQEMRVITGNADAEYGNVNGGEVIMVTKGGTNQFHGSAYSFYENQDLTANLWSNNHTNTPKGVFHQNLFGATLGGPVIHNKLFFFGDIEGYRNTAAGTGTASVATPDMRKGDFSELLGPGATACGTSSTISVGQVQLFNTSGGTGTPVEYPCNHIPINNPVAKYLFAHPEVYPLPNRPQPAYSQYYVDYSNYAAPTQSITVNNQGDARVDYVLGNHDSINSRFSMGEAWDASPKVVLPITFPGGDDYPFIGGVINEVHMFSPNLENNFRAGYSRTVWLQGAPIDSTGQFGANGDSVVGIPYANQPYAGFTQVDLPNSIESNMGTRAAVTTYYDNIFSYGDDLSWTHGKHIVKGGAQILRYQENNYYPSTNGNLGLFEYSGIYTANSSTAALGMLPAGTNGGGYGLADWVLDDSNYQAVAGVAGRVGQRMYRLAFYVQDDWKLTPTLTLNIGVRYGYDQPLYEVNNKEANINLSLGQQCNASNCIELAGQNGNSRALYKPFYGGVMPRLGFAWQLNPKMVFSGGWGITDDMEGTGSNLRLSQNPPYIFQYQNTSINPTATTAGTPALAENGFSTSANNIVVATTRYQAYASNVHASLIQQMNLTMQYLLDNKTTVQWGYVGQLGQHLIVPQNANQWATPGVSSTAPFINLVGATGTVYETQTEGYSNYNALQTQIRRRQTAGLEFTLNYTWSKAMTNNPGFYGVQGVNGASVFPQNIYNPHGDYGPAGYDTRNALNFNSIYALPFGHGKQFGSGWNRLVDLPLGGWKLSGDAILYSGFPVTITSPNYVGSNSGAARANQYGPLHIVNRSINHWFGTDPSATPCTSTSGQNSPTCAYGVETNGQFGTAHVGTERAPGYRVIDMSTFKEFRTFREQVIMFRADAFNAFNMASYAAPGSSASAPGSFGLIGSTISPARQFQFSVKYKF